MFKPRSGWRCSFVLGQFESGLHFCQTVSRSRRRLWNFRSRKFFRQKIFFEGQKVAGSNPAAAARFPCQSTVVVAWSKTSLKETQIKFNPNLAELEQIRS